MSAKLAYQLQIEDLPPVRGRYTENAPLGEVGWFRTGGRAEVLFKPKDHEDLAAFMASCPADIPVTVLGVMSNTIVRDGGIKGVAVRLGREFAEIEVRDDCYVRAGSAALDANVAMVAANAGISGLEFFSGIPGTVGGALRMNAGSYGTETKDVLLYAEALDQNGQLHKLSPAEMGMRYRHTDTPAEYIFTGALFEGTEGDPDIIKSNIKEIKSRREETQPIKERTGGSTFANPDRQQLIDAGLPEDMKVWQLIDRAGCRGLMVGGAQMSEKHCNFMINTGTASASDLENLGEEVRKRVKENSGIELRWEVRRIGDFLQ